MTREEALLLERVTSAHRERAPNGSIRSHPAWHDLPVDARIEACEQTARLRKMEAALDPEGLSTTIRAVLARLK